MADLKLKYRDVDTLVAYGANARTHSSAQIAQLVASINEFGFTNPILIKPDSTIIAGHGRLAAAKKIGMKEVPTITLDGLSDDQVRALVLADNQLALNAGWDQDILAAEIQLLGAGDFDLTLLGFSDADLTKLLQTPAGLTDPDEVPEAPATTDIQPGDLIIMGDHRLLCGDATKAADVQRLLGKVKPMLMVTDPPYGVNYKPEWRNKSFDKSTLAVGKVNNDDRADWSEAWALFPGDVAYIWHSGVHASEVAASLDKTGFVIRSQIIWNKSQITISRGDYHWKHEPAWYAVRKGRTGHYNGDRTQSTVWDIDKPQKSETGHSTQKPVECMARPIRNNSSVGQVVYDPFLGSGTTIIAAQQEGRAAYGLEIDPIYCAVIRARWEAFTGGAAETYDSQGVLRPPAPAAADGGTEEAA